MQSDGSSTLLNPPKIQRLPDEVINQIAAGEVVERPASVVKELVENSLDAGATRIDILLEEGGLARISVVDDGSGLSSDAFDLALERHATSKLRRFSDLESIATFGFRGEALSSIASVANIELKSRPVSEPHAFVLNVSYGEKGALIPSAAPVGTSITVTGLFERVPARQKFLRSGSTEFSHCARVVKEMALGNPSVSFYLHHGGRMVHSYPKATRLVRFKECLRPDWEPLILKEATEDVTLEAYLTPNSWFSDRGELVFVVNTRAVRSKGLAAMLRAAYAGALGPHHEPSGVVYLDIRPDWVDVNVHPQKLEVRLLKQESLLRWVGGIVRKAIQIQPRVPEPDFSPRPTFSPLVSEKPWTPPAPTPQFREMDATSRFTASPASQRFRYLGQAKATYLVCEDSEGIVLLDQHALHEKLVFERLRKASRQKPISVQKLLVPKILRLPRELHPLVEKHSSWLHAAGLEVEIFGDFEIAVKSRPPLLPESEIEAVIVEALRAKLGELPPQEPEDSLRPLFASLACHSVVKAGDRLSVPEAEKLISELDELEEGWTCPHGRPVLFRLNYRNIIKHFERTS